MNHATWQKSVQKDNKKMTVRYWSQRIAGRFSLRLVFSLPFMLQFLTVTCLIGFLLFQGGQEAVGSVLGEMRQQILGHVHEQLKRHMEDPLHLNELNVKAWYAGLLVFSDTVGRERQFVNHLKVFPDAAMTYIGLADGEFYGARRKKASEFQVVRNNLETGGASWYYSVSEQGDGVQLEDVFPTFDPRTRPWYQAAQEARKPVFSEVYRHFVFHEPTITATYPIFNEEGQLVGVFGVDYLLSWLGNMLRDLSLGASGQVFVVDKDGMIVAASVLTEPFEIVNGRTERIKADACSDPVLKAAVKSFLDGKDSSFRISLDDHFYSVSVDSYEENGLSWKIYVVLADEDFMENIWKNLHQTAVGVFFIMIAVFGLAVWTAGWVTRPILRLNQSAQELAQGRLYPVPDTERQDELGQLSRSFNRMAEDLLDLVGNLEARVIERTQNLAEKTQEEQHMREKFYKELTKAGQQQRAMLPDDLKESRLSLEIIYEPYMLVSGDSCGYRWLNEDSLFGYIIDVTGHGVASALQAAALNLMLQEIMHLPLSLSDRMLELNRRVNNYFGNDVMVAAFFFELDFVKQELRYVAAGITEFIADSAEVQGRIKTPGLFLGVSASPEYEVCYLPIEKGNLFCFYSDGIADRLMAGKTISLNADYKQLVKAIKQIGEEGVRWDDVTVLCIQIGDVMKEK
ncbi:cache domain-containing protein [Pelosinus propionicus]|uniref:Serine phosphatase RsbU, regulator of sigma subunit n=1 Tax=Pelosinus propionicus DSM 13327 TaxID=1123291 RepID=A0A1I4NF84_9FIRM|nr:cache domain-containing protein [Pelosinus propionicus]SFM13967.1 Serine phosphatase RsbU, regulator of sigma subunit [Pelosinus propionicus DSM 13327]